jgi:orotate phosphoribosyltransferase
MGFMNTEIIEILKKVGAFMTGGHFVGTSGIHINTYVNKDALYTHPQETSRVCELMAQKVKDLDIDAVVGPALGGIILSQWTAYHLSKIKGKEILAIYTEKNKEGVQQFTRGYDKLVKGRNILVVEDAPTTGGSAKKVVDIINSIGGKVVAVSVMVNKNQKEVTSEFFGAPFFPLAEVEMQSYEAVDCLMCKNGIPVNTTYGHGKKFLENK